MADTLADIHPTESVPPPTSLTDLREVLVKRFSVEDLRTLCFDVGEEYEALPGEGKEGKARELVAFLGRRDRIPELEEKARRLRPDAFEEPRPAETKPPVAPPASLAERVPPAPHETINQHDIADLFRDLIQPTSHFRVLRLIGDGNSGKTHFMTKVFPMMARDAGIPCAVITLRYQAQDPADILHAITGYLGGKFEHYETAYREMQNRPGAQISGLQALLSRITINVGSSADDPRKIGRDLVRPFVNDLRRRVHITVLLFDAVNDATEVMQAWLTDTFIGQAAALDHLRIVVAGRSVPEPCGSYRAICDSRELLPVEEEEAYITFCRRVGVNLVEQSIRDFARASKYRPGAFVGLVVPNFTRRRAAHA